ncbi:hypothetical protein F66182_1405 [Fusarium sp. NRRL 66182]|nr:hypothetical protein F66182_1405 [Fusarium sp. NRRL 66182]
MTKHLQDRFSRDCDADEDYYTCSHWDFEFAGCCSHNPCVRPRGCRDTPSVFIDSSLIPPDWFQTDLSSTESVAAESMSTDVESTATESMASESMTTEPTHASRRRTTATAPMDEHEEETLPAHRHTAPSRTMTDSGITRTIHNPERVTVIKSTLIITDKLPTPTTMTSIISTDWIDTGLPFPSASFGSTTIEPPAQTSTSNPSPEDSNDGSASIGVIVGGVVGGIAALALVVLAVFTLRRRRQNKEHYYPGDIPYHFEENSDEKGYISKMLSRNTTQRSHDPFAPFGGRADRVDDPLRPPSGTFEMDGTSTVPVELPAVAFNDIRVRPEPDTTSHVGAAATGYPAAAGGSMDPRANLNASLEDRQQKQFVNHWNQYRAMGEGDRRG